MPYLTWMADALRAAGLRVEEVGGWRTRGHGQMADVKGVLLHHTAGPAAGNYPSFDTVVGGRPGLDGPLAQLGLARDGTWLVIAAGQAWHAGAGYAAWCGRDNGNAHLIGVEAESTGKGDWTKAQLAAYPRGVAALLRHIGQGAGRALAHKEWAPTRKIDPAGWPGDMSGFRATVARFIANPQEEEMPDAIEVAKTTLDMPLGPGADPQSLSAFVVSNRERLVAMERAVAELTTKADVQTTGITQLSAAVDRLGQAQAPQIDYARLAAEVAPLIGAALAGQVADELKNRLAQ